MDKKIVDVVCPLYKGLKYLSGLYNQIIAQKKVEIGKIVFPITNSSDDEFEKQIQFLKNKDKVDFFIVEKGNFSHSLTRQKAVEEYCSAEVVVFLSQDVNLINENSFYELTKEIFNHKSAYNYGRQICKYKNIEKYIREKNYPAISNFVVKDDIEKMQLFAFFASDAFSAIDRNIFIELGGYNGWNVMMSEDMLYAKIILDAGYCKGYIAEAVVEHSHKFTLKQLYRRYFDTGIFFEQVKIFNKYKATDSGLKLAISVLKQSLKDINFKVLLRWLPDMASRYLGMKAGKKYARKKYNNN